MHHPKRQVLTESQSHAAYTREGLCSCLGKRAFCPRARRYCNSVSKRCGEHGQDWAGAKLGETYPAAGPVPTEVVYSQTPSPRGHSDPRAWLQASSVPEIR